MSTDFQNPSASARGAVKDNTQPEALAALIERFRGLHIDHEPDGWPAVRTREITALLDRIAELEAQLEAIGAGGVSALMGAAKAGSEPVAWQYRSVRDKGLWFDCTEERAQQRAAHPDKWDVRYLYTHPSPQEGMAVTDAMIDAGKKMLHNSNGRGVREKVSTCTFRWEQDGAGGDHGTATYFPGMPHEISLRVETFAEAHELERCICYALNQQRWDARAGLLAEIARIKP